MLLQLQKIYYPYLSVHTVAMIASLSSNVWYIHIKRVINTFLLSFCTEPDTKM